MVVLGGGRRYPRCVVALYVAGILKTVPIRAAGELISDISLDQSARLSEVTARKVSLDIQLRV